MQPGNTLFTELAKLAGDAKNAFGGVKDELEQVVHGQIERILNNMDLVSRDEFEAARAMAQKARIQQEDLQVQVAALTARLEKLEATPKKAPQRKTAAKPKTKAATPRKRTPKPKAD